jgi:hypothetical protein
MTKPMITIHNSATGEIVEREMNTQEFQQYEMDQANDLAKQEAEKQKAADKAALLERLGITADEAALLLS